MDLLSTLSLILAISGLFLGVVALVLYFDYFLLKGKYFSSKIKLFFWPSVFMLTIGSVFLSLIYSEYFGFVPCALCWLQRIAIYPQALLSIIAYRIRDEVFFPIYGIGLSVFGFAVASYQYIEQMLPKSDSASLVTKCLLNSNNSDCAVKVIDEFGFVTFPLISAITFALLIILYLYVRKINKISN